jgi:hypothetical protein
LVEQGHKPLSGLAPRVARSRLDYPDCSCLPTKMVGKWWAAPTPLSPYNDTKLYLMLWARATAPSYAKSNA